MGKFALLNAKNDIKLSQQILQLLHTTLNQNSFIFNNKIYQPPSGLAMGSPLSNDIAEIFLQHYEQKLIKHLMEHKSIIYIILGMLMTFSSYMTPNSLILKQSTSTLIPYIPISLSLTLMKNRILSTFMSFKSPDATIH